jgi:hypothetical protein
LISSSRMDCRHGSPKLRRNHLWTHVHHLSLLVLLLVPGIFVAVHNEPVTLKDIDH